MIENHYGVTVDSEVPTTGVFQNNHVEYMWEDMHDMVDLDYEQCLEYFIDEKLGEIRNLLDDYCHDEDYDKLVDLVDELNEPDIQTETSDWLIGFEKTYEQEGAWFWFPTLKHGYVPDPDAECSAIVGECYTQVVASKWTIRGALCSPCYPGQVDAVSNGEFLGYSLPPDYFEDENPLKKRIRRLGE